MNSFERIEQKNLDSWNFNQEIDLMICDIPFGISFTGKPSNYNRKSDLVVDGYVEWKPTDFYQNLVNLFKAAEQYLRKDGSLLIFSGWQASNTLSTCFTNEDKIMFSLRGKLYWNYNFAPYCKIRPATNCYEIFWFTKTYKWFYNNECSLDHCQKGESNLSTIFVKKEYLKGIPKYPTRLSSDLVRILIEHFSGKKANILDPLCGSGIVGVVCKLFYPDRTVYLGDLNPYSQVVYNELLKFFSKRKGDKTNL